MKDDGDEEEEEEEEDEDEMIQRRRRRRNRGGQGRRRKMRDKKNDASEDDDDEEGATDRGRGRRRRANRRRGRGGRRMNNKRARQERDVDEDDDEEKEEDEVGDEDAKTTVESVPSARPTNRKDREEQQKRVRAQLAGVPIDELDSRAHKLMIKYTINSKEEKNETNVGDDSDDSSDSSSINEYYAALSSKGINPIIVSQMIKSVKADWAHKSINPDIDNVLGMAHLFIHFELLTMAGEMFGDIVTLYRDSGLIVPVEKSPVSHPWRADTLAQDRDISPLSRAFIGQSL